MTAKVVIITRTKDRPLFLARALHSIAEQSYREYIHVIVNDGGNIEKIDSVLASLPEEQKDKTRVFHRDEASDAPDTIFNESINRVDSQYFAIHDDDDTWDKDFLTQTVAYLDHHEELGAVVVRTDKVVEKIANSAIVEIKRTEWMADVRAISLYRQCIDNQMTPIATLYRRSSYEKVGRFDDSLPVVGDWEFGIRLLRVYDVGFIDPGFALANYHHRSYHATKEGNTSFSNNNKARHWINIVANRYLRDELQRGELGVGYIMSKLRYDQHEKAELVRRLLPSFISNRLKRKIQG